jgi:Na+-transporting methylmalonyl-CoA/oxaloacetate decarboxylase gamma subunit
MRRWGAAMTQTVLIIVIALLFIFAAVVGFSGRGARRATEEREQGEAHVISERAKEQEERSAARRAGVVAHEERVSVGGVDGAAGSSSGT